MDTETIVSEEATKNAKPPRRPRGLVNALWVKGLDQAEQVAQVARRESVAGALRAEELPASEKERRLALIGLLQGVQTAAKRKWARSATEHSQLKAYYVGTTLKNLGFAGLAEAGDAILRQAQRDTLPGMTPEKLMALESALVTWKARNAAQSEAQNTATQAHTQTERLFREITTERIQLQLTADAAFPYGDKANGAIRTEFGLPKNGPYKTA